MIHPYRIVFIAFMLTVIFLVSVSAFGDPLTILTPTPEQTVREYVKIAIPVGELGDLYNSSSGQRTFAAINIGAPGAEQFVTAVSLDSATKAGNNIYFYWNSKAPYRDEKNNELYFKDGNYSLKIEIYQQLPGISSTDRNKPIKRGSVSIVLKNKVARTNPAPGVWLTHSLKYGQTYSYKVHSIASIYAIPDSSSGVKFPVYAGLGITNDFRVIQTVEDIRKDGGIMLRCSLDDSASSTLNGVRTLYYQNVDLLPQLYRLVDKFGRVLNRNVFTKQQDVKITDILPVLPDKAVKEGDSWPDHMVLKLEGLSGELDLSGTTALDSFEWQNGKECAKLISELHSGSDLSLNDGKILKSGPISAKVTTFFAYKTNRMVMRRIELNYNARLLPGAGDAGGGPAPAGAAAGNPTGGYVPESDMGMGGGYDARPNPYSARSGTDTSVAKPVDSGKPGAVSILVTITTEK